MTFNQLLDKYRAISFSEHDKGSRFEALMKNFLLTYPEYREKFSNVWLWNDFPFRDELGTVDLGIDIVCKTFNGDFWAVQCKFYAESTIITKSAVDTFLATSSKTFDGDKKFSARLWISTSDNLTDNAEITLQNQSPEVLRIGMEELSKAAVDWEKLDAGLFGKQAVNNFREPLEHQLNAINSAQIHFQNHNRGKLIMACGTGKTYTSLKIAEKLFPNGKILFLVPSISLLGQILHEWATFAENPFNYICVCSDETVSKKTDDEILSVNLPLPATTNPDEILRRMKNFSDNMTVVFSTYQSLDKVSAAKIEFDLIICDEAHRTTGYGEKSTEFTRVHDENFIHGKKRLYMTATPRLYTSEAKKKAADNDLMLWSMDDAEIYGEEFFHIGFGEAVEKNLLSDYKVLILTVNQPLEVGDKKISTDDKEKVTGCINALQKKLTDIEILGDPTPMKTAVGFCSRIKDSERIAKEFISQGISAVHVDGKMSGDYRSKQLSWLKETPENDCRIITNARCLSEGVDVPSLDAILFLSSKRSQVDIVQAVGRVMRKAPDKKYGYIIIPVVVPLDKSPETALAKGEFDIVWKILNALRAHDSRMDIFIEEIKLHSGKGGSKNPSDKIIVEGDDKIPLQTLLHFDELKNLIYARMVERVGNRRYWEQWAKDIAQIAERHIKRIKELVATDLDAKREFGNLVYNLQQNLNPSVTNDAAYDMLAQHIVTRPVFEALFENYSFVKNNPVSKYLENILSILDSKNIAADSEQLKKFYDSVRERCKIATSAEDRQKIIIELYEKFFKTAAPLTVERLGIVYTPVEVVDFILRSVNEVLKENFGKTLSSKGVHILDPFTGTGTFITRLIQSNLISNRDILRKYFSELHANEIILLAYYIAAINIENAFHDRVDAKNYQPFEGICFTDTFQAYEQDENAKGQTDFVDFRDPMKENSERVKNQTKTRIEVIVGNPPYSVGQRSANDNAQNIFYSKLERRIAETYAAKTDATNKNSLYDSYIKAIRLASDKISAGGVMGLVTNAGWLDGAAMDSLRKCFEQEFSKIYVFNLRGNQRTQGETSRREGGKIFGSGSRAPISITILVKNPAHVGKAQIFYKVVDDYLTREQKLNAIKIVRSLHDDFQAITPNERGDWINQRGDEFDSFIPLHESPIPKYENFFMTRSNGLKTQRDAWCYNFSRLALANNIRKTIDAYNQANEWDFYLAKDVVWTRATKTKKYQHHKIVYKSRRVIKAMYRPFCQEFLYYDTDLNEMIYQMDKFFPNGTEENLLICVPGVSGTKDFSVFITNKVTDLHLNGDAQCFPLYWYEGESQLGLFEPEEKFFKRRRDGISDWILNEARKKYGVDVSKEDIFYYVYGFLHLRSYREKFSAELKKSLPRIILTDKFWELSRAGRQLAEIHLNYETQPAPDGVEVIGAEKNNFAVKKLRFASKDDRTTLIYNDFITIKNIPPRCFEYVVNGRSPLEWIIDRYQIKTDSASGIVNNPNDWATEHGDEKYILNLILSSITVSLKTLDIIEGLPDILVNDEDV
ncbi:MAG: DEAD/DEAH box helicase [Selenomonadaceae bacterium]|nr:DEAD/DEAH box helicase [Selenomonadaceae bacterium]